MANINTLMGGIVKGKRFNVPPAIREANSRANACSQAAPWHGNRPGSIQSDSYYDWIRETTGFDPEGEMDYEWDDADFA